MRSPGLVVPLLALGACAGRSAPQDAAPDVDRDQVVEELLASTDAWNRGDLDGFLAPYLSDPNTTFAGSSGIARGVEQVRAAYLRSYWRDGPPSDSLAFEIIEVRPLDDDAALVLGRYALTPADAPDPAYQGVFSLVFVRTADGWKITHDHSSDTGNR